MRRALLAAVAVLLLISIGVAGIRGFDDDTGDRWWTDRPIPTSGEIVGLTLSGGEPVPAEVSFEPLDRQGPARSQNGHGSYRLSDAAPGSYRVRAELMGCRPRSRILQLVPGRRTQHDFDLDCG